MCTAISINGGARLFGRTLDLECSFGENIVLTPRRFDFNFLHDGTSQNHSAILGVAWVRDGFPLYFDAINESGVGMAALNFPRCAIYNSPKETMRNIASFELIPWILINCESVADAVRLLRNTNITVDSVAADLPTTPLHWIVSDREQTISVEPTENGIAIYENDIGVLTNSPDFSYHMTKLSELMYIGSVSPQNNIAPSIELNAYSRGMGAIGLPGDYSSTSRFIRAVFAKEHTAAERTKTGEISRFFHIMDAVSVPCGTIMTEEGKGVRTVYTSCADLDDLRYYCTTYSCRRISSVSLAEHDLDGDTLECFPMPSEEDILNIEKSSPK